MLAQFELILAAILLMRMHNFLKKNFGDKIETVKFWTDSMIGLCYTKATKERDIFVENRIQDKRTLTTEKMLI